MGREVDTQGATVVVMDMAMATAEHTGTVAGMETVGATAIVSDGHMNPHRTAHGELTGINRSPAIARFSRP